MTDKFAGLNMRMPAVAGGFVAPPNAFSSGGGYGISPELESKIDALLDRLNGNNRPIEVRTTVELDKRKVGESIYTYTEERNRGGANEAHSKRRGYAPLSRGRRL